MKYSPIDSGAPVINRRDLFFTNWLIYRYVLEQLKYEQLINKIDISVVTFLLFSVCKTMIKFRIYRQAWLEISNNVYFSEQIWLWDVKFYSYKKLCCYNQNSVCNHDFKRTSAPKIIFKFPRLLMEPPVIWIVPKLYLNIVVRIISSNTLSSDSFQNDSCLYGFTRCAQLCETDNMQFILCYLLRDFAQASGFMILLYNCISWWTNQFSL